jgi:aldehyde dehydrogenase (NAD+)
VDTAYEAARKAFGTTWGLNAPGSLRGKLLARLADLMERDIDAICALEALDNGKTFEWAKNADLPLAIDTIRHYAGWADKNHGQVIEVSLHS